MKARLIRDGSGEVKLLCADGSICNPDLTVLRSLLFDFRNASFSGNEGSWSTLALDMSLVPGETLAYITDDAYLVVIDVDRLFLVKGAKNTQQNIQKHSLLSCKL